MNLRPPVTRAGRAVAGRDESPSAPVRLNGTGRLLAASVGPASGCLADVPLPPLLALCVWHNNGSCAVEAALGQVSRKFQGNSAVAA
jgi:hypothetical protein